ncbi:M20 family metallopeptidase [Candidatus Poribacteria bacterium]|nr:M20 family metallopeptidase [Candidatus Poribacteria bacterium]
MDAKELTKTLIGYNTVSPRSNVEVMDFLTETLESIDCEVERVEYKDPAGVLKVNLIGRKGPENGERGLALLGHIDTVPAIGWAMNPFEARIADGKMYGRGSCDMKGSVSCMIEVASSYANSELKAPLYVVITADEEVGYFGARAVAEKSQMFKKHGFPQYGVVGEPTELHAVYAHKGAVRFTVTAHGRAAHSSTGEGDNANLKLIPFLAEMRNIYQELISDTQYFNNEFNPPFTDWNITISDGECAANITSPLSVCSINYRPMPGDDAQIWIDRARESAERHGLIFDLYINAPPVRTSPDAEIIQAALEITGEDSPQTVAYSTDAAVFAQHMETVIIGPGSIRQAHTVDEWMALDQFPQGVSIFNRFVERFCVG